MNTVERCDTAFKQIVQFKCYEALTAAGFTRFRKEHVDWPIQDGFHCWVGLNTTSEREYVEINPNVGVHVVPIERLWNGLKVGKYPGKYNRGYATYALHMGLLAPKVPVFHFDRQTDIDTEAARLAHLYATVGLGYAKSIASYERLLPLLKERIPMLGAYPERVASCLYLMGRKNEARMFVEDFMKVQPDYFEGFAIPFLKFVEDQKSERIGI